MSASVTAKDFLKDCTSTWIASFERILYSSGVVGDAKLDDGFHICVERSNRSETHNPIPFVASMNCFELDWAVQWYYSGWGSNDSYGII